MPRPLTGKLRVARLADGRRAFYARVRGTERLIGQEPAWSETRARGELAERIVPMAKLGQPWWDKYGPQAVAAAAEPATPTLHGVATDWVAIQRTRYQN